MYVIVLALASPSDIWFGSSNYQPLSVLCPPALALASNRKPRIPMVSVPAEDIFPRNCLSQQFKWSQKLPTFRAPSASIEITRSSAPLVPVTATNLKYMDSHCSLTALDIN